MTFLPSLAELLGLGEDPEPQIPDVSWPEYRNPPSFPLGKPWALSEEEWSRYEAAGWPEVWPR